MFAAKSIAIALLFMIWCSASRTDFLQRRSMSAENVACALGRSIGGHRPPLQNKTLLQQLRGRFLVALQLEHHSPDVFVILVSLQKA